MSELVGRTLGTYHLLAELGHGGMANVYLAEQPSMGRKVAIKVLPSHFLQDRTFLERFNREVKVIAGLQHPRILPVHDYGQDGGMPYIVMAYMPGGTLADVIQQSPQGMPLETSARLVAQIAEALDYAHRKGVIHRDFKPSNVLLDEDGNVHLADFGIAKVAADTAQLTGSGLVGTPQYMAPEMSDPDGLSPQVDVYALGITLFQMLTGRYPYEAPTPMGILLAHASKPIPAARQHRPDLPDAVQAVLETAMAKNPSDRCQGAGQLAEALFAAILEASADRPDTVALQHESVGQYVENPQPETVRSSVPSTPARPARQINWLFPFSGIVVGLVVIVGAVVFWQSGGLALVLAPAATEAPTEIATEESIESGVSPTPTETVPVVELGYTPVTGNADWTSVFQDFDGVQMALVPAGCFQMGTNSGDVDEKPVHRVCFEKPFWIDVLEVSQAQFAQLGGEAEMTSFYIGENLPRERITWTEADNFCQKRNLRLPTEAEWEYAARGPDGLVYPWGNEFIANNVVYSGTGGSRAQAVGSMPTGASWIGALDMSGNVWEWVNDRFTETYYATLLDGVINPQGPETGRLRVTKGGSVLDDAGGVSAARRIGWLWYFRAENGTSGFRCGGDIQTGP